MPTPENMFETLPHETLVTATGGVTKTAEIRPRDLWQLKHVISDAAQSQQATNQNATTMAMMAMLAMRR